VCLEVPFCSVSRALLFDSSRDHSQNCLKPTFEISTMLLLWLMGVSGYARSETVEHKGKTKRHMFS
jgi:hypothetical protein